MTLTPKISEFHGFIFRNYYSDSFPHRLNVIQQCSHLPRDYNLDAYILWLHITRYLRISKQNCCNYLRSLHILTSKWSLSADWRKKLEEKESIEPNGDCHVLRDKLISVGPTQTCGHHQN